MTFDIGNNVGDHIWPCRTNWKWTSILYFWFHQCKIITANQIVWFGFTMKISSLTTRCQSEVVYFVEIRLITDTIIIICNEWILDKWIFAYFSFSLFISHDLYLGIRSWGWILALYIHWCMPIYITWFKYDLNWNPSLALFQIQIKYKLFSYWLCKMLNRI